MAALELDYEFGSPELLEQALTHRSVGRINNERLEFLGDSVLNCLIADELFRRFPEIPEGDLSRLRARLVNQSTLANIGREMELGQHVRLGSGEKKSGGHRRASILADAVEAVLGAVYLDGGFEACRGLVKRWFDQRLDSLPPASELKDPKTRLQEMLQGRGFDLPTYSVLDASGADHQRVFTVACEVAALGISVEATGTSRRKAEQAAAEIALDAVSG
ncbi:MAG: ribonuclease III [Xanthomonadales bacterium]|nr:ribonuclease III [Xanthomonadales bacterium]